VWDYLLPSAACRRDVPNTATENTAVQQVTVLPRKLFELSLRILIIIIIIINNCKAPFTGAQRQLSTTKLEKNK